MNEFPFQRFIALIAFDQSINALGQEINVAEESINANITSVNTLMSDMEEYKRRKVEAKKDVDQKELDMATLGQKQKDKMKKLESLSDHKAYKALSQEIDYIKQKQHEFEEDLIEAWKKLELAAKEYEHNKSDIKQKTDELTTKIEQEKEQKKASEIKLEQQLLMRPEKCTSLPEEWIDKYEMMRTQVTDPVVEVQNGSCDACFYAVTQQDMVRLRRKQLIQCKGCYRFLYLKEAYEPAETV